LGTGDRKTHAKRWATAVLFIPVLIYLVGFAPRWAFYALLCLASILGLGEFYSISAGEAPRRIQWPSYALTLALFAALFMRQVLLVPLLLVGYAMIPMSIWMFSRAPAPEGTGVIAKTVFGPLYVCVPLALLVLIDFQPQGRLWIFFLLLVVFATDTGAFYCGRSLGRHKLYESLSPGKTWEGTFGGLILSLIAGFWFLQFFPIHPVNAAVIVLMAAISVSGQIGDLAESMLKRNHGVKDSGRSLPGHGGILDRIDGLLFSIPVLFVYLDLWVI